jgi:hypothetical protein
MNTVLDTRPKQATAFGILFLLTGIFSFVSSLFAWGEGWLFSIITLNSFLLPMADLLITVPLSFITAYSILTKKRWGSNFGILTVGVYLFGSILVFITLLWKGQPYPILFLIPSVTGFVFALTYFIWVLSDRTYLVHGTHL